jgi:hypothetical protein
MSEVNKRTVRVAAENLPISHLFSEWMVPGV